MNKLSEKKIIDLFQSKLGNANFVPEDVESFKIGKEKLVVKVDTFVESTDLPPRMKLGDAARKSIVSCVSDFAAKGVKPIFGIVSLTIPRKLSRSDEENLANRADRGGTEPHDLTPTERSLPKKNTVIPSDPATPSPAVASYTNEYLGDLTRRR